MLIAFFIGLSITIISVILSLLTNNWYLTFIFSVSIAAISIVVASILKNITIILKGKAKTQKVERYKAAEEIDGFSRILTVFGIPSIIAALILYFKLYR